MLKSVSAFAFAMFAVSLVHDAFGATPHACRRSDGARACTYKSTCPSPYVNILKSDGTHAPCTSTYIGTSKLVISDHDKEIKCTWEQFQGQWAFDAGEGTATNPMTLSQTIDGTVTDSNGNPLYAICSGWDEPGTGGTPPPAAQQGQPYPHDQAPHGFGKFSLLAKYMSASPLTCNLEGNTGIGDNCVSSSGKKSPATPGASRSCALNSPGGGTTLTVTFACASTNNVSFEGHLTLAALFTTCNEPACVNNIPSFTGCNTARFLAGACKMLYGLPTKLVKGQPVIDDKACADIFLAAEVPNGLNEAQSQPLDALEIAVYKEVSATGLCEPTSHLPSDVGLPVAAYGRHCQSNIGPFADNAPTNIFGDEASSTREGFDFEQRGCAVVAGHGHKGDEEAEKVSLGFGAFIEFQGPLNVNCETGGNTDQAAYRIKIPDQEPLFAKIIDIDDAPKLEGVAPTSPPTIIVDSDGVTKLLLAYNSCTQNGVPGISEVVKQKYGPLTNNQNVTLSVTGHTIDPLGSNSQGLGEVEFSGKFTTKVNGVK